MRLLPTLAAGWRRLRFKLTIPPRYVYMGGYGIATTWRGDRILVPGGDTGLPAYLATSGRWESYVERLYGRLIRPGDLVVDAGANVGYHALGMARAVGPGGHVHVVEPNPRLTPLLRRTLDIAGYHHRTTLHAVALAEHPGMARLVFDPQFIAGGALDVTGAAAPAHLTAVDTPTARLDDMLADGPPCALLRMDLEGSEGMALLGARKLIARSPRLAIITEWAPELLRARGDLPGLVAWLESLRFRAYRVHEKGEPQPIPLRDLVGDALRPAVDLLLTRT